MKQVKLKEISVLLDYVKEEYNFNKYCIFKIRSLLDYVSACSQNRLQR